MKKFKRKACIRTAEFGYSGGRGSGLTARWSPAWRMFVYGANALVAIWAGAPLPGWAGRPSLAPEHIVRMELSSPEHLMALAVRIAPGPQGAFFLVLDPRGLVIGKEDRPDPASLHQLLVFAPGHPEFSEPSRVPVRRDGATFIVSNLRMSAEYEGKTTELILDGNIRIGYTKGYFGTGSFRPYANVRVSGVLTIRDSSGSKSVHVARIHGPLSPTPKGGAVRFFDFSAGPVMDFRLMEGGRLAVANLTLGPPSGRALDWIYVAPARQADRVIQAEAIDSSGAVIETIQLRPERGGFAAIDRWQGRFRRLRSGQTYEIRASVDLGPLGRLQKTLNATVFDY